MYGPSQLAVKAFFFPGFLILTIVSPAIRPSKAYFLFLVA
jgi:hypothetical protein